MDTNDVIKYLENLLAKSSVRYQIQSFNSGAHMIDIWVGNKFYCIQIEPDLLGISLVEEAIDFSTIPDKSFQSFHEFKYELERILSPARF